MKHTIIGNGPSVTEELLESISGETWAVNRIWKIFNKTQWRPDNWVRGELPEYDEEAVKLDFKIMRNVDNVHLWIQEGFVGHANFLGSANYTTFRTCEGTEEHDWHWPKICGYGTVVNIAMQLAIMNGATELELVGCDLGMPAHFYGKEGRADGDELALKAHKIASRCCPVIVRVRNGPLKSIYERKENG